MSNKSASTQLDVEVCSKGHDFASRLLAKLAQSSSSSSPSRSAPSAQPDTDSIRKATQSSRPGRLGLGAKPAKKADGGLKDQQSSTKSQTREGKVLNKSLRRQKRKAAEDDDDEDYRPAVLHKGKQAMFAAKAARESDTDEEEESRTAAVKTAQTPSAYASSTLILDGKKKKKKRRKKRATSASEQGEAASSVHPATTHASMNSSQPSDKNDSVSKGNMSGQEQGDATPSKADVPGPSTVMASKVSKAAARNPYLDPDFDEEAEQRDFASNWTE